MRRLALAGLLVTAVLVLVLLGSLVRGVARGGEGEVPRRIEAPPDRRIRVEVLNAAGVPRMAQRGTDRLRDRGFDVVYYGNARGFHPDTSLVLDRVGDPAAAEAVARAIGIRRVREAPDSTLYLEVSVILGSDWEEMAEETRRE